MSDLVLTERDGALAIVTINRPEALNAMNPAVLGALKTAFDNLAADGAVRVIILTGSGDRAFIAGADIADMADQNQDEARDFMNLGQAVCLAIERAPQVVIGALNGYALGGGCEVALACDVRIASEKLRIGLPEVTLGIMPGWGGTQRLPRIVGLGNAKQMIYTGEHINAEEALRTGLVNKVVPPDQLMDTAKALAEKMLKNGPLSLREAKETINLGQDEPLETGLQREVEAELRLFASNDRREGMRAFLEKRPARYQGR